MALKGIPSIAPYHSMGRPTGATNAVTNSSAETNTTGWTPSTNATVTRVTTQKKFGAASFEITTADASNRSIFGSFVATAGSTYTLSAWLLVPDGETATLRFQRNDTGADIATTELVGNDDWQFVSVTGVAAGTGSPVGRIRISIAHATTFWADGIQAEGGSVATPHILTDSAAASRNPNLMIG